MRERFYYGEYEFIFPKFFGKRNMIEFYDPKRGKVLGCYFVENKTVTYSDYSKQHNIYISNSAIKFALDVYLMEEL